MPNINVILSIGLLALFGLVCVGLRAWLHVRRTGETPFRNGPAGSGRLAVIGFTLPFLGALVLDLTGRGRLADSAVLDVAGVALAVAGIAFTLWSQLAMGDSWRIGVDTGERTALVTRGPYRVVRNPIYTGMFAFAVGLTLLVPNVVSIAGLVAVVGVIGAVVIRVEEPYLASVHGDTFRRWAARTGRFLPRVVRHPAT